MNDWISKLQAGIIRAESVGRNVKKLTFLSPERGMSRGVSRMVSTDRGERERGDNMTVGLKHAHPLVVGEINTETVNILLFYLIRESSDIFLFLNS